MIYMCVCSGIRTRIVCPNYEVARIVTRVSQPGIQPQTVANPALDYGCPMVIIEAQWRQIRMRRKDKWVTKKWTEWDFQLPHVWDEGPIYSLTEHPENWPLPGSVRIRYRAWAWTLISPPSLSFLGFRNIGFKSRER